MVELFGTCAKSITTRAIDADVGRLGVLCDRGKYIHPDYLVVDPGVIDAINDYITENIEGDCLLAVGDEDLIKIHFHTNTPWKVIEYASTLGEIYDIVVENMERQEQGLKG